MINEHCGLTEVDWQGTTNSKLRTQNSELTSHAFIAPQTSALALAIPELLALFRQTLAAQRG
jgi:hypothetical protein